MMSWLMGLLMCLAAAVSETWTRQLLRRVPLELAQIASTMGDHWTRRTAIPLYRGFAMAEIAEMLHHLSVVLLLIALVLFLYSMDRAAAISVSALAILCLVAHLRRTNCAYLRRSRL